MAGLAEGRSRAEPQLGGVIGVGQFVGGGDVVGIVAVDALYFGAVGCLLQRIYVVMGGPSKLSLNVHRRRAARAVTVVAEALFLSQRVAGEGGVGGGVVGGQQFGLHGAVPADVAIKAGVGIGVGGVAPQGAVHQGRHLSIAEGGCAPRAIGIVAGQAEGFYGGGVGGVVGVDGGGVVGVFQAHLSLFVGADVMTGFAIAILHRPLYVVAGVAEFAHDGAAASLRQGVAASASAGGHETVHGVDVAIGAVGVAGGAVFAGEVPAAAVPGCAIVIGHRIAGVAGVGMAGDANATGDRAGSIIEGVGAGDDGEDDRPGDSGRSAGLHFDIFLHAEDVDRTAVRVMALATLQAESRLRPAEIGIAVRGDDRRGGGAGSVVAGEAKRIAHRAGVQERCAGAGVGAVATGAGIGQGGVTAVRAGVGLRRLRPPKEEKSQKQANKRKNKQAPLQNRNRPV